MEHVVAFQFCQAIVAITFAVFISDFKKKAGMVPLISEKWTYVLKLLLMVPLFVYSYALLTLNGILPVDMISFGLTFLGTALVVKAKWDLSRHHTWTGFCMEVPKLVVHGIYSYIRHPPYAGVYFFCFRANVNRCSAHKFVSDFAYFSCLSVYFVFSSGFSFTRKQKA